MKSPTQHPASIAVLLGISLLMQNTAIASTYHFENVVDNTGSSGFNFLFFTAPAINDSDTLAFRGQLGGGGGFGMFRTTGGTTTKLADNTGDLSIFDFRYAVNNNGNIAFLPCRGGRWWLSTA